MFAMIPADHGEGMRSSATAEGKNTTRTTTTSTAATKT